MAARAGDGRWLQKLRGRTSYLQLLQGAAAVVTILSLPLILLSGTETVTGCILAIFFCALFVLCWGLLILQEYRYSRKARYAEAAERVHLAFHRLRDAWFSLYTHQDDNAFLEHVTDSVRALASAFSLVAGVHCRVCIKELFCPDEKVKPKARALVTKTLSRSEDEPDQDYPGDEQNYVWDNTDFLLLFRKPEERKFFCNNLLELQGYKNSHWTPEMIERKEYKYVSTIVWPIRKTLKAPVPEIHPFHERHDCLGFLCVDSLARGAFRKRFDVWVGAAYADVLYAVLKGWKESTITELAEPSAGQG